MRGPGRWFKEDVLGPVVALIVLRRVIRAVDAGWQPDGERVLVWTDGRARIDDFDVSGRLMGSTPLGEKGDTLTRGEAEALAAELGWRFESDR